MEEMFFRGKIVSIVRVFSHLSSDSEHFLFPTQCVNLCIHMDKNVFLLYLRVTSPGSCCPRRYLARVLLNYYDLPRGYPTVMHGYLIILN